MKKESQLPEFQSESEEGEFWREHDASRHLDWSSAKKATFPNLRPSTRTISLRLSGHMLDDLKVLANSRNVPYQSPLKVFLAERIGTEFHRMRESASGK